MNKSKILIILAIGLGLTACSDDNYVSTRHPQGEESTVSSQEVAEVNENEDQRQEIEDTEVNENEDQLDEEASEEDDSDSLADGDGINYTVEGEVNVRLAPSENSNILTTVNPGDDILKLGDSDNWSRISIDGQTGYIRSDLLIAK